MTLDGGSVPLRRARPCLLGVLRHDCVRGRARLGV